MKASLEYEVINTSTWRIFNLKISVYMNILKLTYTPYTCVPANYIHLSVKRCHGYWALCNKRICQILLLQPHTLDQLIVIYVKRSWLISLEILPSGFRSNLLQIHFCLPFPAGNILSSARDQNAETTDKHWYKLKRCIQK